MLLQSCFNYNTDWCNYGYSEQYCPVSRKMKCYICSCGVLSYTVILNELCDLQNLMCKMILSYRVKIFNMCACVSVYELSKKSIQIFRVKTQIKFLTNPICVFSQYLYWNLFLSLTHVSFLLALCLSSFCIVLLNSTTSQSDFSFFVFWLEAQGQY